MPSKSRQEAISTSYTVSHRLTGGQTHETNSQITGVHQCYSHFSRVAAAHEECERLERIIVKDFDQDLKGHREKLAQGHRVRKRLDELQALSTKLVRGTAALRSCQAAISSTCTPSTFRCLSLMHV